MAFHQFLLLELPKLGAHEPLKVEKECVTRVPLKHNFNNVHYKVMFLQLFVIHYKIYLVYLMSCKLNTQQKFANLHFDGTRIMSEVTACSLQWLMSSRPNS